MAIMSKCGVCSELQRLERINGNLLLEKEQLRERVKQQTSNYDLLCRIAALEQELKSLKNSTSPAQPEEKPANNEGNSKNVYIICN